MSAPLHPWDIQPGETARAYQAFAIYRDMGPERSLAKAGQKLGKNLTTITGWSTKYGWVERAAAFDAEAARRATAKSLDDHAEVRARQAQLGRLMQARGAQRIGQLDPSTLEAKEARMLASDGARIERDALGLGTKVEVSGPGGGPVETVTRVTIDLSTASARAAVVEDAADAD